MIEVWKYRHLVKKIALSELKLRYKNSVLGLLWSLLEPLLVFIVLYFVFSYLMKLNVEHYHLFLFLGIICWDLFEKGTTMGLFGITSKPSLVKKVYFPREVLVVGTCLTALIMVSFELIVFLLFMLILGVIPPSTALVFPFIILGEFLIVVGISLALSALNVYYRDVQYIWAVLLRAAFFMTPVIYPVSIYPPEYIWLFMLNPIARVIEASRRALIYGVSPTLADFGIIYLAALVIIPIGYIIFMKLEPRFAEEV
ncbi:MAG: ABC-type polysaccharide/polyol phosphate export permease [Candidatus Fermentimicrarchaeum limneticum]|uniref:ABC-type polysaccharide/polyol phosphate export permease n=1 Tax=Fermentimicrarchaeum limneticum TaxID=2795018 RepID=A0A7D5XP17_FERL1|nr:MAG: ABC-type polysaccharide/polyol phosphate export permease [Candidatus Fermentimicrarchaeum limneticum]